MDSLRKMLNDDEGNDEESHILGGDVRYPFLQEALIYSSSRHTCHTHAHSHDCFHALAATS